MPINLRGRREKVFGPGRAVPLDRNAKARIEAYVKGRNAPNKQPRHSGLPARAEGAGVGRRADLAASHHQDPSARA
jgi:hypothetical protein